MQTNRFFLIIIVLFLTGLLNCREEQKTTPPANKITFGAYYYPWFGGPGLHWNKKNLRQQLIPAQAPVLGEYDCRKESIIKQHLEWAKESGIDFFALSWWGENTPTDVTISRHFAPYLTKNGSDFKFCISYATPFFIKADGKGQIPLDKTAQEILLKDFLYLARTYFAHPNYLKINNRPVVILYLTRIITGDFEKVIPAVKSIFKQQTAYDLFLIGDEVFWDEPNEKRIVVFDAITSYNMYGRPLRYDGYPDATNFFEDLEQTCLEYRKVAQSKNVKFIPNVMPGYNDRGSKKEAKNFILPRERNHLLENQGSSYQRHWLVAQKCLDADLKMALITSWNSWDDDTQIEPAVESHTPIKYPMELTGGYNYFGYGKRYLKLTREAKMWMEQQDNQ